MTRHGSANRRSGDHGSPDHAATTTDKVLHWARLHDVVAWVQTLGNEQRFRERLVELAQLEPGESVLDIGCGTGTLAIGAKRRVGPGGSVCGVDASPEMIARARRKAARAGVDVRFETAAVEGLPFPDATFDAVLSTLMLHHMSEEGRRQGIAEIARVTKPEGRFVAVDIGGGSGGKHHRLLRLRAHAHFDLDELRPALDGAGLHVVDGGPFSSQGVIGLPNLRFVRATAPPR